MININKQSWHYRFIKYGLNWRPMPKDLCGYFKALFFSPFNGYLQLWENILEEDLASFIGWSILIGIIGNILYLLFPFSYLSEFFLSAGFFPFIVAGFLSAVTLILGTGTGLYIVYNLLYQKSRPKLQRVLSFKPPLLLSYLKAKKQKICPLIEYKD